MCSHTRRPAWLAVTLAAVAATVAVAGCGGTPDDPGSPPTTTMATVDVTAAPTGVRWGSYQGIALPFGDDGPSHVEASGAVSGFTHTPHGAALAGVQQSVRVGVAPDSDWAAVTTTGVVAGPERDTFAVNRVQVSITAPVATSDAPRILGYQVVAYHPDRAALTVYTGFPDASLAATDVDVVWAGGDWRLQLPAADALARVRAVDTLPATAGFVALEAP